jgi:ribosomal protein S18 acetylase RimI-like enzyme
MIVAVGTIRVIKSDEWQLLRSVRLTALRESPSSFMSSYKQEATLEEQHWQNEFIRGKWMISYNGNQVIGLIGITKEATIPTIKFYLEYLWVHPDFRHSGEATALIKTAVQDLRKSNVSTTQLWILEGNEIARKLYERLGFKDVGIRQQLKSNPSRHEELMILDKSGMKNI